MNGSQYRKLLKRGAETRRKVFEIDERWVLDGREVKGYRAALPSMRITMTGELDERETLIACVTPDDGPLPREGGFLVIDSKRYRVMNSNTDPRSGEWRLEARCID